MVTAPDVEWAGRATWAILIATGLAALGATLLFSTGIGPAFPAIKSDLGLSLSGQTWTVTGYGLAFGVGLVAGGRLGDLTGEIRIVVAGLTVFAAGLIMSAVAAGAPLMIGGRVAQGLGVGIAAPATLSVVFNAFPANRRGFAVGGWGLAHVGGGFAGPLFCTAMMRLSGWRAVFWGGALVTSMVGAITTAKTSVVLAGRDEIVEAATDYTRAVKSGDSGRAGDILTALPADSAEAIRAAAVDASSAAITASMLALSVVALVGAAYSWMVIGRDARRDTAQLCRRPGHLLRDPTSR